MASGLSALIAQFRLRPELLQAALGLVAVIFVGVLVLTWLNRWRKQPLLPPTTEEELAHYRKLVEQGLLSKEEFERIRGRLEGQVRQMVEAQKPAPPAPSAGPSSNGPAAGA
jgi:hypothetical protein